MRKKHKNPRGGLTAAGRAFFKRKEGSNFEMTIHEPYKIEKTGDDEKDAKNIILKINQEIEKMILNNPTQWIWSHNRWK